MNLTWGRDWPAAALVLATGILIVPLWCVHTPAMPDYPAHLAGFYLIGGAARTQPLAEFYRIHWMLVPNLASELVVPLLGKLVSLNVATKLFLSVAVAMWVLGPAAIQRAVLGRLGPEPLAGAFFAYNANFTWGFFNYYFATGLCFVVFAAWLATEKKKRGPAELAGFALAVGALYACHLIAAFLFLVMIGCWELYRVLDARDWKPKALALRALPIGLIFVPVAIAYLFFRPAGTAGGQFAFDFSDTIGDRFGAAIQSYFDEPAYLLTGALVILILAGLIYDRLRVHPGMRILVIVLALLALLAPEWALGGWGVHLRLPGVLGVMTFASLEMRLGKRVTVAIAALLLLVACYSAALLTWNWRGYDRQYAEFRQALRQVPEGAKLVTVLDSDALDLASDQPYWHMAEYAIIDRGDFTPLMFTTKGQHIVRLNKPYQTMAAGSAQQGSPPDVSELIDLAAGNSDDDPDIEDVFPYLKFFQCHFTQAIIVRGDGDPSPVPNFLTLRHTGSFFSLYDIHPTAACKKR